MVLANNHLPENSPMFISKREQILISTLVSQRNTLLSSRKAYHKQKAIDSLTQQINCVRNNICYAAMDGTIRLKKGETITLNMC